MCLTLFGASAHAANKVKYNRKFLEVKKTDVVELNQAWNASSSGGRRTFGTQVRVGATATPGTSVGTTYYDYQHNASAGRQVDEAGGEIQVTYMRQESATTPPDRSVNWNKVAITGSPTTITLDNGDTVSVLPLGSALSPNGNAVQGGGAGYTNFRLRPNGKGVAYFHSTVGLQSFSASPDPSGLGVFINSAAPQPSGYQTADTEVIWPKGTVEISPGGDTVVHVVATARGDLPFEIWYYRGILTGATVTWDVGAPVLFDTAGSLSAVVEARGDSVVIAYDWTFDLRADSATVEDVVYRLSTDGGLSWGSRVNLTNYNLATSDEIAYQDIGLVWDDDGVFHIIWNTLFNNMEDDNSLVLPATVKHWNSQRGTIRTVTAGNWANFPDPEREGGGGCSEAGTQNGLGGSILMFSKPTLVVKPAGAGPGAGIADELLYCVWSQGGPVATDSTGDCASQDSADAFGGFVNMEIYCSVSSDKGFTWDRPTNVTGTETPLCFPGTCASEGWVSAAREADSGIYLSYTLDTHPSGAVGATPYGEWAEGTYRVLALTARQPIVEPVISLGPQTAFDELHVDTVGNNSVTLDIENLGNANLDFTIAVTDDDGGDGHVLVNGVSNYVSTINAGNAGETVTIQFDGVGEPNPSEFNWRLEITSNDANNDPGQGGTPIDVTLNVFVANPFFACVFDSIQNANVTLAVSSCLEIGNQGGGGGLRSIASGAEWLFDMSPVLAWNNGSVNLAYRDVFWNSVTERNSTNNQAFRAQSDISVNSFAKALESGTEASGVATSTDSIFQFDWTVSVYDAPELTDGMVATYQVTNRTGSTYSGLHLGAAADLDIDSLSGWNDGIASEPAMYVGGQGGYGDDTTAYTPQPNFAAIFYVALDSACNDKGVGGQVLDNEDYVYPEDAYNTDSVYSVLSTLDITAAWGANTFQADSITDLNVIMANATDQTLGPNDTLRFAFGLAVSSISEADLATRIALLRQAANDACLLCPIVVSGDVNISGALTSADIIYLVNFVFKGQAAPLPCPANGDVNCSGAVTSADIIYLVNHVFKGQAAPCDICNDPGAQTCIP